MATAFVPKSIKIEQKPDYLGNGNSEVLTDIDVQRIRNPKKVEIPVTISGKLSDGKKFVAEGAQKNETINVTSFSIGDFEKYTIKVGGKEGSLPVKTKDGKLTDESLANLTALANGQPITVDKNMFGLGGKKVDRSMVTGKVSSLGNTEKTEKAMLAASNEASSLKEAAQLTASNNSNFVSIPGKQQNDNKAFLG